MSDDQDIIAEFLSESLQVIKSSLVVLEEMESDFSQIEKFKTYANLVDRVMGASQSIMMMTAQNDKLQLVSDYTTLFKTVANHSLKINLQEPLYDLIVALLIDATETLDQILNHFSLTTAEIKKMIRPEFLDRVRLIKTKIVTGGNSVNQNEIDVLIGKLQ